MYITNTAQLEEFCAHAQQESVVAVDTEFLREKTYYPKLCLIQVGTKTRKCAIDPFYVEDMSSLKELFENPNIVKVFHACSQDLEILMHALDCTVNPVFDTQVAAAFLGYRMQIGYSSLVASFTGVQLPKAESLTDWSHRPLDAAQLKYAEDDVEYLPGIYEEMMRQLVDKDRLSWLNPEMSEVSDPSRFISDPRHAYRKLKRSNSLSRRQLAVAREVCEWRELEAMRRDVPRKWIVSDEVVVEICKRVPKNAQRLMRIRTTSKLSNKDVEAILAAAKRGQECSEEDYPEIKRKSRLSPETESVVDLMYSVLRIVSQREGIASQMIATRDDLQDFLTKPKVSKLREGWRYEIVGKHLAELLDGELGLTVKDGQVEFL